MTNSDQQEEMIILSSHIFPVWQKVVQAGQMDRMGNSLRQVLSSVVSRGMVVKKVMDKVDNVVAHNFAFFCENLCLYFQCLISPFTLQNESSDQWVQARAGEGGQTGGRSQAT